MKQLLLRQCIAFACIASLVVLASAVNPPCNGTVLEWNIGIVESWGSFRAPGLGFDEPGSMNMIPALRTWDLDFQANWNPVVKAAWGAPLFGHAANLNPCLRIRPLALDGKGQVAENFMQAQANAIWGKDGQPKIDGLIHSDEIDLATSMHASVMGIPQISMSNSPMYQMNRPTYKYHFRYAASLNVYARKLYSYFVFFGWRSVNYVYSTDRRDLAMFEVFSTLWVKDNRDPKLLITANVPDSGNNFEKHTSTIRGLLTPMKRGTTRLTMLVCRIMTRYFEDRECEICNNPLRGSSYAELLIKLMKEPDAETGLTLWSPHQQIIASETIYTILIDTSQTSLEGRKAVYDASLHWTKNLADKDPGLQSRVNTYVGSRMRYLGGKANFTSNDSAHPLGSMQSRLGLLNWPLTSYKAVLSKRGPQDWPETPLEWTYSLWYTDILLFWEYALSDLMNKHKPTSKSQITAKMIADAISVAAPTWTVYGGSLPYQMKYENGQEVILPAGIFQIPTQAAIPSDANDGPICCDQRYGRNGIVWFNNSLPRWVSDPKSNPNHNASNPYTWSLMPPSYLVKCSPGQYLLPGRETPAHWQNISGTSQWKTAKTHSGMCAWCQAGRFSNTTDQSACTHCSPGTSSSEKALKCDECPKGKATARTQSVSCTDCLPGTFAEAVGQSVCAFCQLGFYGNQSRSSACFSCGGSLTTAAVASMSADNCLCGSGSFTRSFNSPITGIPTECGPCMQGLDCDSTWPDSWNAKGNGVPILVNGFYSTLSSPYETYKCFDVDDCPGGLPEQCDHGRSGLLCNACAQDDYFISNEKCEKCPTHLKLMILFGVIVAVVGITGAYYAGNGRLAVNADNPLAFFLFVGLAVTTLQVFTIFKDMSIPWPTEFGSPMTSSSSAFALDVNSISIECAVGKKAAMAYLAQVLLPYGLLLVVAVGFGTSRVVARFRNKPAIAWEAGKALNVCGALMQALFIAFCAIMVKPMQCYEHPNGMKSMLAYPRVLCYEGGQHTEVLIMAGFICLGFVVPFIAWCVWGCLKAPSHSSHKDYDFLKRYRFLLYRFRPDYWWWGLIFVLRQTALAFATVVPADNPHMQLAYTAMVCAVYGIFVARMWPWISHELSIIDTGLMLIMLMIMLVASQFLPEPKPNKGRFGALILLFLCLAGLFGRFLLIVTVNVIKRGVMGEFGGSRPNRFDLSKHMLEWLEYAQGLSNADVVEYICQMNSFDRKNVFDLITSWHAVAGAGYTGDDHHRLQNLPTRHKMKKDQVDGVAGATKRVSLKGVNITTPTEQNIQEGPTVPLGLADFEHNTTLPRSFRVLASHGTVMSFPFK